jgi:hypothetical protein
VLEGQAEPEVGLKDLDNFMVLSDQVVFLFDFGIPHVIEVATPISELSIPKADLRGFVRRDGPLRWLRGDL